MHRTTSIVLSLSLALLFALPMSAISQDKANKKKKRSKHSPQINQVLKKLKDVELKDEQSAKIKELASKFEAPIQENQKKLGDGKKKIAAARKAAIKAGKKGKEVQDALVADLSDDQKKAFAAIQKNAREFRAAVVAVLTPEQQEKTGLKPRRTRKNKRKKADDAT